MPVMVQESTVRTLQLVTEPTYEQVALLWQFRLSIPEEMRYAFADVSPTFDEFLTGMESRDILCVLTEDETGEPMTAAWLHDLEQDHEGIVRMGWLGGYAFPNRRGRNSIRATLMMLKYFGDLGVHHIHTAVHVLNRQSQIFVHSKKMLGFTKVCDYANWTAFGGEPADFVIYTRHLQDKMLAWMCANNLVARRSRALSPA